MTPHASRLTPHAALIIFAKAPIPGQVKTRLCPPLTLDEAASLHGSFVLDALERSQEAGRHGAVTVDRFLACAPPADHVFFKIMEERQRVRLLHQTGDDLGARMDHAFKEVFALGYQCAILVGTDMPSLPASCYGQAVKLLSDHDLVLGPSLDGGYYLIGLKRPTPDLFIGIPWSTDQVFSLTRTKAEVLGLKSALLPTCRDVDTIDDLLALIEENELETTNKRRGRSPLASSLSLRTAGALRLLASRLKSRTGT
ncbi:MAG: TIGR04282 family arsenosugar biosynthesis glycosyltransferase [Nitrospiraceae bacterium]